MIVDTKKESIQGSGRGGNITCSDFFFVIKLDDFCLLLSLYLKVYEVYIVLPESRRLFDDILKCFRESFRPQAVFFFWTHF